MTSGDAVGLTHAQLVVLVVELSQQVEALTAENQRLRAEAANSGNSSKPSSRDPVAERKRQAEERQAKKARAAGGKQRRPGKQLGAKGTTLEMTDSPDEVIDHAPESCSGCGSGLADAEVTAVTRRQVIDIPLPAPVTTEHRAQARRCGCCGTTTTASFPRAVRAPVSYGPRVRAIVVYLLGRQHIPVQRSAEAMADLFGVKISTGTVDALTRLFNGDPWMPPQAA